MLNELVSKTTDELISILRGGPGSGHHGHRGRPGKVGGSLPAGAGESVHNFFKVPQTKLWSPVRKAMNDIDKVHRIEGAWFNVGIPIKRSKAKNTTGTYYTVLVPRSAQGLDDPSNPDYWTQEPDKMMVVLEDRNPNNEITNTTIHEFGHMFDHVGFGRTTDFTSELAAKMIKENGADYLLDPANAMLLSMISRNPDEARAYVKWWDAVQNSDAYAQLQDAKGGTWIQQKDGSWLSTKEIGNMEQIFDGARAWQFDSKLVRSFRRPREYFARAYAQYISLRSGNQKTLDFHDEMIQYQTGSSLPHRYWDWDDFGPIAEAFDEILEAREWQR